MRRALELAAQAANLKEVPVGALIVHNNQVISESYNTREMDRKALAHAEIRAIEGACEKLGRWRLDARWKGTPSTDQSLTISDVPAQKWNVLAGDLTTPVAILRQSALEANAAWIKK